MTELIGSLLSTHFFCLFKNSICKNSNEFHICVLTGIDSSSYSFIRLLSVAGGGCAYSIVFE